MIQWDDSKDEIINIVEELKGLVSTNVMPI